MNWYKKAQSWEEIKKYGPVPFIKDPYSSGYIQDTENADLSLAIEYLKEQFPEKNITELSQMAKNKYMMDYYRRMGFVQQYGWSIPTEEALEEIKDFIGGKRIVEVGAGYGLWAKLMRNAGIQIVSTDIERKEKEEHVPKKHTYTDIERLNNLEAIQKYGDFEVLMMVWPPYDDPMAYETLKRFNGNKLIFVGEGQFGCTACDNFFSLLNKEWSLVKEVDIPRWRDVYDRLYLYERN